MSYAAYPKNVVKKACNDYLNARNNRILARQEELIQKKMNGLFGKRSRESVIQSLSSEPFSDYNRIAITGQVYAVQVEKLLALAETSPGDIFLDSDDADTLRKYL